MERMVSEMERALEIALAEIGREKNAVLRYDRSVKQVQAGIEGLKEHLRITPFTGMAEEIFYFRELAPRFYSRLFYFMKLQQVESFRLYASAARFREALERELQGIEDFFLRHNDICRYYYQQTYYWDEQLFTRRGRVNWPTDDISVILDADFCLGSYWVSWIKANERYRVWLEGELRALSRAEAVPSAAGKPAGLKWVGSSTDLVELINGMHLAGSFGEITLKETMEWFEGAFGIDLGHFYATWQEIARRKKSRTKYVDLMRERLMEKMEGMD